MTSLHKSRQILRQAFYLYKRKKKKLLPSQEKELRHALLELQEKILEKNPQEAEKKANALLHLANQYARKTFFDKARDLIFSLIFALLIATLIRQIAFELYEIPTGSMRPTFMEKDHLLVSKTDFGINIPLTAKHFYFDPSLISRGNIAIFTVKNMDVPDPDMLYFYLFPGKKQFIKRIMGKPEDTLYFYGGKIYGIDTSGKDISSDFQIPEFNKIESIPFLRFEIFKVKDPSSHVVFLYQMNEPIARLFLAPGGEVHGEMLKGKFPFAQDFYELWGMENFATARLLTPKQVKNKWSQPSTEGLLYLELTHHPSVKNAKIIFFEDTERYEPSLGFSTSLIPLKEEHLKALFNNLYTARFCVKGGELFRFGSKKPASPFLPKLSDVPDGCYEFYYGKAFQISFQGISKELPPSHPLYKQDLERLLLFYNLGIEFDLRFMPKYPSQNYLPSRFAYFRKGDLYLLGAPIIKKNDPLLLAFHKEGAQKKQRDSSFHPFEDRGPPFLSTEEIDKELISRFGLKIPPGHFLALGDNHAMSSDSRIFGFVPEDNLRGGPSWIFWPPGSRFGPPHQPPYPFWQFPRICIWSLLLLSLVSTLFFHYRTPRLKSLQKSK